MNLLPLTDRFQDRHIGPNAVETAEMLIEAGIGQRARYFHRSWIYLPEDCTGEELQHRLLASYQIVRAGLPRKVQAALPAVKG